MDPTDPTTGVDQFTLQPESIVEAVAALNRAIDQLERAINDYMNDALNRISDAVERARKEAD